MLEGVWKQGFMALAAVGATNIGSIEVSLMIVTYPKYLSQSHC